MRKFGDLFTSAVKRAIDMLFVLNPRGTSVGVFVGVCFDGAARFFRPALSRLADSVDVSRVATYHFIAAGIVLFNLPLLFRRRELPKEIEEAFEAIRRSRPHVTAIQTRMQYLALLSEVVARTQVDTHKRSRSKA